MQGKNKPSRRQGKKQANIIEERKPAIKVSTTAAPAAAAAYVYVVAGWRGVHCVSTHTHSTCPLAHLLPSTTASRAAGADAGAGRRGGARAQAGAAGAKGAGRRAARAAPLLQTVTAGCLHVHYCSLNACLSIALLLLLLPASVWRQLLPLLRYACSSLLLRSAAQCSAQNDDTSISIVTYISDVAGGSVQHRFIAAAAGRGLPQRRIDAHAWAGLTGWSRFWCHLALERKAIEAIYGRLEEPQHGASPPQRTAAMLPTQLSCRGSTGVPMLQMHAIAPRPQNWRSLILPASLPPQSCSMEREQHWVVAFS